MSETLTADSLARIYIRAQDEAGHWGNVNLKEATDEQFETWVNSKVPLKASGKPWTEHKRLFFVNLINRQVQQLVMVPEL